MHNTKNEGDTDLYIKVVGLLSGIVEILAILIYTGVYTVTSMPSSIQTWIEVTLFFLQNIYSLFFNFNWPTLPASTELDCIFSLRHNNNKTYKIDR